MAEVDIDQETRVFLISHWAEHALKFPQDAKRKTTQAEGIKSLPLFAAHLTVLHALHRSTSGLESDGIKLKEAIVDWFCHRYAQAVEELPYESAEGGYQFINGPEVTVEDMRAGFYESFGDRGPAIAALVDLVTDELEGPMFDPDQW